MRLDLVLPQNGRGRSVYIDLPLHALRVTFMSAVVITGASQGIGQAIAEAFAKEPESDLALLARSTQRLGAVARRCSSYGARAAAYTCDVTDDDAVARVAARILATHGAPGVLVNNAGHFQPGAVLETTPEQFRRQLSINLTSAFTVTRAFLEAMISRGRGHIFFMGSVVSLKAYPGAAAYSAAKHGLLGLARVVREETKTAGIRVTSVLPGATLTPSWDGVSIPEERFMPAEDIALAIVQAHRLSGRSVVEEILLRPQEGDI